MLYGISAVTALLCYHKKANNYTDKSVDYKKIQE